MRERHGEGRKGHDIGKAERKLRKGFMADLAGEKSEENFIRYLRTSKPKNERF
ncbi:MAG: hypothetical protein J0H12_05300 [Candidatus Paracaedimonas acanthamoebae]|uniref:Uncharacterized protein n=1 Tax=Candidatus Paracaedimonas acanthamoebae TaxID=244581 RepID=A0A8J7PT56_9PROT|nr:hypothetical protein [Candidatus Paracaedimonas acanthamoebae]